MYVKPRFLIECRNCIACYRGKTYKHIKVRVSEDQSVSPKTGKPKETLWTCKG